MKSSTTKQILLILMLLGIVLRFVQFGSNPISLNRDEAALLYNAYSISTEGIDEWGISWPISFKSFGDYKLPGYIYILAPFVKVFGMSEVLARLPSLLAGLLILLISYLLIRRITNNDMLSLCVSVMISISPWAIFYSRMAWEAHVSLMMFLAALYFLVKGERLLDLGIFFILYLLSMFTYNSPIMLAPMLGLVLIERRHKQKTSLMLYGYLGAIFVACLIGLIALLPVTKQKSQITIFSDPTILMEQNVAYAGAQSLAERVLAHKYVDYGLRMAGNLYSSLSPRFLLGGGPHPWHSIPQAGHFTLVILLLAYAGFVYFAWAMKSAPLKAMSAIILILLSLAPALITVDAPHGTRSLFYLWLISILSGYGLYKLIRHKLVSIICLIGLSLQLIGYGYDYLYQFPITMPANWPTGLDVAILEAASYNTDRIVITNSQESTEDLLSQQLYIYGLVYTKTQPRDYLNSVDARDPDVVGLNQIQGFNGFEIYSSKSDIPDPTSATIIERYADGSYAITN